MIKDILKFFDKLEDKVRGHLSHYPIFYAFIGGVGIVLFWRGVWHTADELSITGFGSLAIGTSILLVTGIFVSSFVGNKLIISGLMGGKKLTEKATDEIEAEEAQIQGLQHTISRLEKKLDQMDQDLEKKN
ncbi:MAG: hypothetical protein KBD17_00030 [Candidatus Pacebacteria bacterium]|nr:hypothetical protein [Candidatus Paceibacterota bacterium]